MLTDYRVLDLTDEKGMLCGKLLANVGAEVIKIEPPGGDPARRMPPLAGQLPEKSLFWLAYNTSKKGITLNVESRDGQELFKHLVQKSDVVIESFAPGYLDRLGMGYAALSKINPKIILTSITPFGQTGPYAGYRASDLTLWCMGGLGYMTGDEDRPPVQVSFPQSYLQGAGEGAVGTMTAIYHREATGEGQHVDVSIQASVAKCLFNAPLFYEINGVVLKRSGPYRVGLSKSSRTRSHWPCQDGHIAFVLFGGSLGARVNRRLVEYMDSEGMCPDFMKAIDWQKFDLSNITQEEFDRYELYIGKFFMAHTKRELFEEAVKRGMTLYPVADARDLAEDTQLRDRGFWQAIEHPEVNKTVNYPGKMVRCGEPILQCERRAPRCGEHNSEIYEGCLGLSRQELVALKGSGVI